MKDCQRAVDRWNKSIVKAGVPGVELRLPHRRFNRAVGPSSGARFDVQGDVLSEAEWASKMGAWLPTAADRTYVQSLMVGVFAPGQMADWIAPPGKGINGQPLDFEYVKAKGA